MVNFNISPCSASVVFPCVYLRTIHAPIFLCQLTFFQIDNCTLLSKRSLCEHEDHVVEIHCCCYIRIFVQIAALTWSCCPMKFNEMNVRLIPSHVFWFSFILKGTSVFIFFYFLVLVVNGLNFGNLHGNACLIDFPKWWIFC